MPLSSHIVWLLLLVLEMTSTRLICLLIALDFIFRFQVVRGVDEYSIQRFDLSPTASLLEERRQRRLQNTYAREGRQRRRRLTIPNHWLHPYVNAIYATLQWPISNTNTTDENGPSHNSPNNKDHEALIEFHGMRHWSRYERAYQQDHQKQHGLDSSPLRHDDIDWYDYYHNEDGSVYASDDQGDKLNRTARGRRRLSSSIPASSSSLYGGQFNHYQAVPLSQGYGTHYVNLWVGSPTPQRQTVIADTGSHFTAFPCVGCHKCGAEHHTDPYFNPEQSETFHALQCNECVATTTACDSSSGAGHQRCQFTQSYTEGSSWKAYQARDLVYGGGQDVLHAANMQDNQMAIPFLFGCLTSETGLFVTQLADGIMGMSAHELTLVKQLYNAGKLEHNMFAMCFRRELGTSKRGVTAGSMTLGGVSSSLDTSPMVYAKNIQPYGKLTKTVSSISLQALTIHRISPRVILGTIGWFTVFVKGVYIAKNGGNSFVFDKNVGGDDKMGKQKKNIIKVPLDLAQVNSGKGVIVDSGTTGRNGDFYAFSLYVVLLYLNSESPCINILRYFSFQFTSNRHLPIEVFSQTIFKNLEKSDWHGIHPCSNLLDTKSVASATYDPSPVPSSVRFRWNPEISTILCRSSRGFGPRFATRFALSNPSGKHCISVVHGSLLRIYTVTTKTY